MNLSFEPRGWQKEALKNWVSNNHRGIVKVVTGGGKTIFSFFCISEFFSNYPKGRIFIILPTLSLLDQWYVNLLEDLNLKKDKIAVFSGDEKSNELSLINLFVINTARELVESLSVDVENEEILLIVDECHRAGSEENSKALNGNFNATLGLSATPERDYDSGFEDRIKPKLGKIIFDYDYKQALKDKVIVDFELVNVKFDLQSEERDKYNQLTKKIAFNFNKIKKGTGSQDVLKILMMRRASISNSARYRIPITCKLLEENRGRRAIVFHEKIDDAVEIYNNLVDRGFSATIYHSKINSALRRDNLRLYRKGVFDVLVTCRALDEGLNVPETEIAIIASSTSSERQRIQRLGRVLRPSDGKVKAKIYTLFATTPEANELKKEYKEFSELIDISWIKANF